MSYIFDNGYPAENRRITCSFCAYRADDGACLHPVHGRFQKEPDDRCARYTYRNREDER